MYSLDDEDLDNFEKNEAFDKTTLQYTIVTFEDRQLRFENGKAFLLNNKGTNLDENGSPLSWDTELENFGELREGISQLRLRKSTDPGDVSDDVIGRVSFDTVDPNALIVDIDTDTLPTNTLTAINGIIDPLKNYPGDGTVPAAAINQRYLLTNQLPAHPTNWTGASADKDDIIEYNGTSWTVTFDASSTTDTQFVTNTNTQDQFEWNGEEWFNSYEGIYKAAFWRLYL